MLRLKQQKPGRLYTIISILASLVVAVGLFLFPADAPILLIMLLMLFPLAGYVLDRYLNTAVKKIGGRKNRIFILTAGWMVTEYTQLLGFCFRKAYSVVDRRNEGICCRFGNHPVINILNIGPVIL